MTTDFLLDPSLDYRATLALNRMAEQAITSSRPRVATSAPALPTQVRVPLIISEMLYDKFAAQAITHGRAGAEEEIMERLTRFQDFSDVGYLIFDAQQKRELEVAMGRTTMTPEILLAQLKNAVTLKVDDVEVQLEPKLQQRLRSRIFRGETYEKVLRREVLNSLRQFVGLLPR